MPGLLYTCNRYLTEDVSIFMDYVTFKELFCVDNFYD